MRKNIHHENYLGNFHSENYNKSSMIKINNYANYVNSMRKFVKMCFCYGCLKIFGLLVFLSCKIEFLKQFVLKYIPVLKIVNRNNRAICEFSSFMDLWCDYCQLRIMLCTKQNLWCVKYLGIFLH